jgi:hypothetical protein
MKRILAISALAMSLVTTVNAQDFTESYARANQNVTLDLQWSTENYGSVQWQLSTDDGKTWSDIQGATKPTYTFKITSEAMYRAVVDGDPSCPKIVSQRKITPVSFNCEIVTNTDNGFEMEITGANFANADIVEYGYTANLSALSRNYTAARRETVGTKLPEDYSNGFVIAGNDLIPNRQYSVRAWFKTSDGSIIFGPGKLLNTLSGPAWTTEGWIIEKTQLQVPFEFPGVVGKPMNITFQLGKDKNSLKSYNVESLDDNKYRSELISNLEPNTTYIAVVTARIDGEDVEIEKEVKTWSDYSSYTVDETVKPVSHIVEWDSTKTLTCLSPEGLQVEYPRMCRVDENKILLTYHGGTSDHWQNSYLRKSYDNGKTWTDPVTIYDTNNEFLGSKYWRICNPEMTKLQNGWIVLSVVANGNPESNTNSKVLLCISKDGGETWGDPLIVGRGRTWEPQVVQMPNGELELLVSSEAYWWDNQRDNLFQEILSSRSTDNGETWTEFKRASYKPGARDGMPVSVVMQGNKGVMFIIESVNGNIPPSIVHRSLDGEWDTADWDNVADNDRWNTSLETGSGAPYMIQLPTGEFLMMAHNHQSGSVWQTCRPQVIMADNTGHNFKYSRLPLAGTDPLPAGTGAYYNSFFLYDNDTVWMLITDAKYTDSTRNESKIMMLEGKIVEK